MTLDAAQPSTPPHDTATPYAGLTPHAVLDALDALGLRGDGRILQLNSYENRVFQVHLEDGAVVVAKFYREQRWSDAQILEEHAFALELAEAEVPVVAPIELIAIDSRATVLAAPGRLATLGKVDGWRVGVTPRCAGRAPELEQEDTLAWIGRFLARIHQVGQRQPFAARTAITGTSVARAACDWLSQHEHLADARWRAAADAALERADALFAAAPNIPSLRLHGDCHLGNLLWRDGPHFVDLDDACNGPAVQDLWMLIGGDRAEQSLQLSELLDGYEQLRAFDRRELRLIEALRTLRLILHSAWIAKRWADPAFPIAFPSFESPSYWAQQTTLMQEQLAAMDEPPLQV